jgi:hypothetical protein
MSKKGRLLFWKKEAKDFFKLGRAGFDAAGSGSKKFLRRFFQKAAASLAGAGCSNIAL